MSSVFLFPQWSDLLDTEFAAEWHALTAWAAEWFGVAPEELGPTMVDMEGPRLFLIRSLPNGEFLVLEVGCDLLCPAGCC